MTRANAYLLFLALLWPWPMPSTRAGDLPVEALSIDTPDGIMAFTVELAATPEARRRGLMYRENLAWNAGMLFDFHRPRDVVFWMKDTPLSLDLLFIRADGTIAGIHEMAEPLSEDPIRGPEPVRAVLELRGGAADRFSLAAGQRVLHRIFPNEQ